MAKNKQKLELTWIGKDEEMRLEPRILIEDPSKSFGDKNTENMLIHGDNLLALKALEQDFSGKVKCIYIDPPFNTGAAFDHYDDGVEHSTWLDLMSRRFKILHNLLANEGVLFVHLDDNEAAYCKVLLDEIFGRFNYINQIINTTNKPFGFKSTSGSLFKQANHIFLYAKNKSEFILNTPKLFIEKGYDTQYKYVFINPDKKRENWKWDTISNVIAKKQGYSSTKEGKKMIEDFDLQVAMFAIENADYVFRKAAVSGGAYLKRKETIIKSKAIKDKIVTHPNDDMDYLFIGGERVLFYKERLKKIDGYKLPGELITDVWTDISIEGLAGEGGVNFPKGKKPEKLVERCIDISTQEGDLVLDSFLGSGTTAAVAHKMNRKYIGIELGEQAYTHCHSRLREVVLGNDLSGITKKQDWKGGGGFKFYNLAPSLLKLDAHGNWIIEEKYNPTMLAHSVCKHEGFRFEPHTELYWKQGNSTEKDFIFVTTNFMTVEQLDIIYNEMLPGESLLICAKSFATDCESKYPNITIKKIPKMILDKCEFGKKNYDLNITNAPDDLEEEIDVIEEKVKVKTKKKQLQSKIKKKENN